VNHLAAPVLAVVFLASACAVLPAESASPAPPSPAGLDALTVRVEDTGAHYDREAWGDWTVQGGCDTRERVLKTQGRDVRTGTGCKVTAGTWVSSYDGVTVTRAGDLDIDHIVPVKEANRSGARNWDAARRSAFYNDTDNLVAVTARSNRQKGDSDPSRWRPVESQQCAYAQRYVAVKAEHRLTVQQDEHDALAAMLNRCPK
jgi:hypothetical protein